MDHAPSFHKFSLSVILLVYAAADVVQPTLLPNCTTEVSSISDILTHKDVLRLDHIIPPVVVGVILCVASVAIALLCIFIRRRRQSRKFSEAIHMLDMVEEPDDALARDQKLQDHEYEEPYSKPASEEKELLEQLKKMAIPVVDENKELHKFEILGSGAFGTVYRGLWTYSDEAGSDQVMKEEVAVKTMEEGASEEDRVKFLQEAAIMGQFNHPNIIRLLGTTSMKPPKIVIELMGKGDLSKHLSRIKPVFGEVVPAELAPTLLSYSRQVANGLMYLAIKCFVHRDIAARNILVSNDGICKIADFGLSRDLQQEDYYISCGGKIPVKWTAPEALHYRKYSTASDVWSYGCVLYEIWSLGHRPFENLSNVEAMGRVNLGVRLSPPPGCSRALYDVMIKCWNPDANHRPAFLDIMIPLQKPDFQILQWSSKDVSSSAAEAKILGAPLQDGFPLYEDLQKTYLATNDFQQMVEGQVVSEEEEEHSLEEINEQLSVHPLSNSDHSTDSDDDSIVTTRCPAYTPAEEVKHSSNEATSLVSVQPNPCYSTAYADHLTCPDVETTLCHAYTPAYPTNSETYLGDNDYI